MLYTIIKPFSKADGDSWLSYCNWRGIHFEGFDSIDGLLRPNLFEATKDRDWDYIVSEFYMNHYLTDFDYACLRQKEIDSESILLGVSFDAHNENDPGFLGYDLIDGYFDISLLTNWGNNVDTACCITV